MKRLNHCYCVFASATEETLGTFEGDTPGTAIRVLVEAGREGYVRLQQLAYTDSLGWYVQFPAEGRLPDPARHNAAERFAQARTPRRRTHHPSR
jgi:hypothetical protein